MGFLGFYSQTVELQLYIFFFDNCAQTVNLGVIFDMQKLEAVKLHNNVYNCPITLFRNREMGNAPTNAKTNLTPQTGISRY